jgi:hypothetical protein
MSRQIPSRILFILKKNDSYSSYSNAYATGLRASIHFVVDDLLNSGVEAYAVEVIDNNDIDCAVHAYQPSHVVLEALWVVPEKFVILHHIHPTVQWIVRIHSELPFLSHEGSALDWIIGYLRQRNVAVAVNSKTLYHNLKRMLGSRLHAHPTKLMYLPNTYPSMQKRKHFDRDRDTLDIGCFGAIRPLKNHLVQAFAAIEYAKKHDKGLRFHLNTTRFDGTGDGTLRNIRSLFAYHNEYQLIEHEWLDHHEFVKLAGSMDLGLQVSMSETFNYVSADHVAQGVPVVVSSEIEWASRLIKADPSDVDDIVHKMETALGFYQNWITSMNQVGLRLFSKQALRIWLQWLRK